MAENNNEYSKGIVLGTIIGGAIGAATALLLAPKAGKELRQELSEKSNEYYSKTSDYLSDAERKVGHNVKTTVNEGRVRAQGIVDSAKKQANEILYAAENVLSEAKLKAGHSKESIQKKIDEVRGATKAGVSTFKDEYNKAELEDEK